MYYFQFTLTGYGKDIEPNLPNKREELIPTFKRLSEKIGKAGFYPFWQSTYTLIISQLIFYLYSFHAQLMIGLQKEK